jgi:tetratricopeptide (TPR) repeat protein
VDRGLARARAFLFEPPLRTPLERGRTWNYIGIRHVRLAGERPGWDAPGDERTTADHWAAADEALGHAAETIPSPRVLREWALARLMRRDLRGARQIYRLMVARDSASVPGWAGIASVSADLGDPDEAKRAAARALRLSPADPSLLRLFERIAPGEPAPPPRP